MNTKSAISNWVERLQDFMTRSLDSSLTDTEDETFNALALERFEWQTAHNPVLGRLSRNRSSERISHWTQIPALPAAAFKEFEVSCIPDPERSVVFYSSGTSGAKPSRNFHHQESLNLYEASLVPWFQRHLAPTDQLPRAIFLTPPPRQAPHSSLVHMFETIRCHARSEHALFAGTLDERTSAWELRGHRVKSLCQLATDTGEPVAMLGTAFNFVQLLDALEADEVRFELPPGSRVMETGGYKGRTRSIPKKDLHDQINERLGVSHDHIVCEYGMSELSSQAYDRVVAVACGSPATSTRHQQDVSDRLKTDDATVATGHFQFPPWARARIISPEHGGEAAIGETGLIQVCDLANAWSVLAFQTEDLGIRRDHGFELIGRIPRAEAKGCSLQAV